MLRIFNWIVPALAIGAMALFSGTAVNADDTPTTAPAGNGSITVNVVDSNSKPVPNAQVRLFASHAKAPQNQASGAKKHHNKALASGITDSNGSYTFNALADGDYTVAVMAPGLGHGHDRASITDGQPHATVNITLTSPPANGGNTGNGTPPPSAN